MNIQKIGRWFFGLSVLLVLPLLQPMAQAQEDVGGKKGVRESLESFFNLFDKEPGYNLSLGPLVDWKVTPGFEYKVVYDSNIFRESSGRRNDDVIMSYIPSLELSRQTDSFQFQSEYAMEFEDYLEHDEEDAFNHRVDNFLRLSGERLALSVEDRFGAVKTYASSEQSEREKIVYNNLGTELSYRLSDKYSIAGIYKNELFRYSSSPLVKFSTIQNIFGGRTYYHITPKLDLYFQGLADFLWYYRDGPYNSRGFSLSLGSRGQITDKFTLKVETGFKGRNYHTGIVNDFYNWTLLGVVKYQATSKVALTLKGERDIQPSIFESIGFYFVNSIGGGAEYQMTDKMILKTNVTYSNNHYPSQSDKGDGTSSKRDDDLVDVDVSYQWKLSETVEFDLGYVYQTRQSNFNSFDYNDHRIESSVVIKF